MDVVPDEVVHALVVAQAKAGFASEWHRHTMITETVSAMHRCNGRGAPRSG